MSAIFKEARRQGAIVIQVNHPFIPYGYFSSVDAHVAPGGFNPGFELVEINATVPEDDPKVLNWLWKHWNAGQHYYLSAGTDTHDVWNYESGRVRTFIHVDGKLTAQSFARALREGHGYVSRGPLIFRQSCSAPPSQACPGSPSTSIRAGIGSRPAAGEAGWRREGRPDPGLPSGLRPGPNGGSRYPHRWPVGTSSS